MSVRWPWLCLPLLALLCSAESGSSLRGAVEALQRRQRSRARPLAPALDYDAMYEFVPPGYPEPDYSVDVENFEEEPAPKYIVKLLEDNQQRPPETYEYKIIKKKSSRQNDKTKSKESAFRERSHHSDDRLRDLFERNEIEDKNEASKEKAENDAEYASMMDQLWSKFKTDQAHGQSNENAPQSQQRHRTIVMKRNWGPIAFKKKRSSGPDLDRPILSDYDAERKQAEAPSDPNYNTYEVSDDDKDDWREGYAIAFQPLDEDPLSDLSNEDQYSYGTVDKRFPVTKRSSGPYQTSNHKKRFVQNQKHTAKSFRSSSGTDPRVLKDLSQIFGDSNIEIIKTPVKRNTDNVEHSHDPKSPTITIVPQNHSHNNNNSEHSHDNHEHHSHLHHPGLSGKEEDQTHDHHHDNTDKPITIRKKSIDWSDYFGIDKRSKKYVSDVNQERLRKQYFDSFNKEVIYPGNSFRKHSYVKRNYVPKSNEETEVEVERNEEKRTTKEEDSKLDDIDKKLKTMEGMIVDEALHYTNAGDELDTKEEQEMKEKLLSRLAAAYSLEKMRKALKEFKQSLQAPKTDSNMKPSPVPMDEAKVKRVAVKKEKVDINNNEIPIYSKTQENTDDFEDEQGAGHYLNGKFEQQYSEGYMGGSGRHRTPVMATASASGSCPVLTRIVQRCREVDMLTGDRGQLFLPLCSLHQICYLCGEAPPTTCDLVFLSEADTTCEGDMACQRAARSALMALQELHDSLADELDGECEASPCLSDTLKMNVGWQRALQR